MIGRRPALRRVRRIAPKQQYPARLRSVGRRAVGRRPRALGEGRRRSPRGPSPPTTTSRSPTKRRAGGRTPGRNTRRPSPSTRPTCSSSTTSKGSRRTWPSGRTARRRPKAEARMKISRGIAVAACLLQLACASEEARLVRVGIPGIHAAPPRGHRRDLCHGLPRGEASGGFRRRQGARRLSVCRAGPEVRGEGLPRARPGGQGRRRRRPGLLERPAGRTRARLVPDRDRPLSRRGAEGAPRNGPAR